MFTSDNSTFSAADRKVLNVALTKLLNGVDKDSYEYDELLSSYSDLLNNAWFEGATVEDLLKAVK